MQVFALPMTVHFTVLDFISTIYWTFDMFVSATTAYVTQGGILVLSPSAVMWRYLHSWFLLDITTVTVDWIDTMSNQGSALGSIGLARLLRLAHFIRIIRLLRFLRFRKFQILFVLIHERIDSEWVVIILRLLRNLGGIIALNHFLACMWYWLGSAHVNGYPSWVSHYGLDQTDWVYCYLTSMHWSLTQFTPASMHLQPQNSWERTYAILIILFAMLVFSTFVSAVTNSMMRLWSLGATQMQDMLQFRKFLRQHSISPELAYRLNRYLGVIQMAQQHVLHMKDVKLISCLSGPLHQQLRAELLSKYLDGHPLFCGINARNSQLMCEICSECLTDKFLSLDDIIFSAGHMAKEMGFLCRGAAGYKLSGATVPVVGVYRGDWFCEPTLWTQWIHVGQLQAKLECEIIGLSATSFRELAILHPIALNLIRGYAVVFICLLNKKRELGELTDLLSDLTTSDEIQTVLPNRKSPSAKRSILFSRSF